MDWIGWNGKKVYIRTEKDRSYSGVVKEVADMGDGLIFLSITDKFNKWVTFRISEISEIREER